MDVRPAARPALLLATLVTVLGFTVAAHAATEAPPPMTPDDATLLATATPSVAGDSSTSAVDGTAALAAANQPGAQTSIEPGISLQAAVGLAPLTGSSVLSSAKPTCWANSMWHQWGIWPYEQKITDTTYWCAIYNNHITYRTSTTTASGTLCGVNWRAAALIGGGIGRGFTYFTNRASAGFACDTTIPWITIHTTHHVDVKRNDRGATTQVGTG
jgi:hypothetical protein